MRPLKVLTLRQPWAWVVVHGGKRIENRTWTTSFRGVFLIHSSKAMTREEHEDVAYTVREIAPEVCVPSFKDPAIERGGINGAATLTTVHGPCRDDTLFFEPCTHRFHMPGQFGFALSDVVPVPFLATRGQLGFFDAPEPVLRHIIECSGNENLVRLAKSALG